MGLAEEALEGEVVLEVVGFGGGVVVVVVVVVVWSVCFLFGAGGWWGVGGAQGGRFAGDEGLEDAFGELGGFEQGVGGGEVDYLWCWR